MKQCERRAGRKYRPGRLHQTAGSIRHRDGRRPRHPAYDEIHAGRQQGGKTEVHDDDAGTVSMKHDKKPSLGMGESVEPAVDVIAGSIVGSIVASHSGYIQEGVQ